MNRACDFCHKAETKSDWYYYKSPVLMLTMKCCLCDKCAEKEKKYVMGKIEKGKIKWMPENI